MAEVVIIGAGIGGLSAAARLAAAGCRVTVLEAHSAPGGKIRTRDSAAGPVDCGPTVLTMKPVFDALFADAGTRLEDHVTLRRLPVIARHVWDDGTTFDIHADRAQTLDEVGRVFGARAQRDFIRFTDRAARLFAAFDVPLMQDPRPDPRRMTALVARNPRLLRDMAPWRNLRADLRRAFAEPKLAQLFARYATYVGGLPQQVPALLALISDAEAQGVWAVEGGMIRLAEALAAIATARGATILTDTPARRIVRQGGRAAGVETDHAHLRADAILFNGDPRALATGLLGPAAQTAVRARAVAPRSLSAHVLAFAARPQGLPLDHHTVLFGHDPDAEFNALAAGENPEDATLYLCAQDHGRLPHDALQRFEIIVNAPPGPRVTDTEALLCLTRTLTRLDDFGLRLDPPPEIAQMTTPAQFESAFPASLGSLYGQSPAGLWAAFSRPTARTAMPGLYICGGGAHPGAGMPMAALSGRHAAAAIMADRTSTSASRRTVTRGGMSTGSPTTAVARSRS